MKEQNLRKSNLVLVCLCTLAFSVFCTAVRPSDLYAAAPDKKKSITQKPTKPANRPVKKPAAKAPANPPVTPSQSVASTSPLAPPQAAAAAATPKKPGEAGALFEMKNSDEPTFIDSDSLTLNSVSRIFTYVGNVRVKQGDMTLTSDHLEGKYGEDNRIQQMVAKNNVTITKGPGIKATSNRAVYDAAKDMVTLMDNPQLFQDGSILSADVVKVYLQENRSLAEGQVRMKLLKAPDALSKPASAGGSATSPPDP